MLERLACNLGRNDEVPNIELAQYLVLHEDKKGIAEIVNGLKQNKAIANDCIKVLYETGNRNPLLIADYVTEFLSLLESKNNRLVWGGMTALAALVDYKVDEIYTQIEKVKYAYRTGSVITVDNSMTVFAKLCRANEEYKRELFPELIHHLKTCRPKEVAQHAERISICVDSSDKIIYIETLNQRKPMLSTAQTKRIEKLIKGL